MTPADIEGYLRSAFDKADVLKVSYEKKVSQQDHQEKPIGTNQRTQTLGLQLMLSSLLHANREYSMRSAALSDVDLSLLSLTPSTSNLPVASDSDDSSDSADEVEAPNSLSLHDTSHNVSSGTSRPAVVHKNYPGPTAFCPPAAARMPFVTVCTCIRPNGMYRKL